MMMNVENIEKLANDLNNVEDEAGFEAALKENGLNLTLRDVEKLMAENEEISEDSLDLVMGGCKCGGFRGAVNNFIGWLFGMAGIDFKCADCGY